jgi:DNA-binding transcriptional LysR family regulator
VGLDIASGTSTVAPGSFGIQRRSLKVNEGALNDAAPLPDRSAVLTSRLLAVHRAVVEHGTLTAAAASLGYTVSAVSQQLAQLELEAATPLFEKAGRGVRPTAAGLLLAERAERILAEIADAEAALADLREGRTGRLRVVSFHSAGEALLPPAIAELHRSMPEIHVLPVVDEADGALRRLRAGDVEVVVVVEPFARGEDPADDLLRVHLLDDEYRLLMHDGDPLARSRLVDVADLAGTGWIVTSGRPDYVRDVTVAACRRAGFSPRFVAEADEFAVTQGYVAAGLGVALAPVLALAAVREHVVVRRLRHPPDPRHIWLATRPAIAEQPAVRGMVGALRAAARSAAAAGTRHGTRSGA